MRKIFIVLFLAIIVFISNFSLWFLHTRAINQALLSFKNELLHNNIKLTYNDIKFTNFISWRVKGEIDQIAIQYGKNHKNIVSFKKLEFRSYPYKKYIILTSPESINIKTKIDTSNYNSYDLNIKDSSILPTLALSLEVSLKDIITALKKIDAPKLHLIDSLIYKDQGYNIIDENGSVFANTNSANISITTQTDKRSRRFDFDANLKNLVFNQDYKSTNYSFINDLYKKLGELDVAVQFTYEQTPSKLLKNLLETDKENRKNYKKVFDSYQINLKKLYQASNVYTMNISGNLDRQPNTIIPDMELDFKIDNYKSFITYMVELYNGSLKEISHNPYSAINLISDESTIKIIDLFNELKPDGENIDILIKHDQNKGITISDKPISHFLNSIQNIFFNDRTIK